MESNFKETVINSKILANHFRKLCKDFSPPYKVHSKWLNSRKAESNTQILSVLTQIGRLIKEKKCDAQTFKNDMMEIKSLNDLHLEILWYLEVKELITLQEFIDFHKTNKEVLERVSQMIFENILQFKIKQSEIRKKMLASWIQTGFSDLKNKTESESIFYQSISNLITNNLKEFYQFDDNTCDSNKEYLNVSCLVELFNEAKLDCLVIKTFFIQVLYSLLNGTTHTTRVILQMQEKIKNNVKDKKIFKFFTEISKYCELEDFIEILKTEVSENFETINWNNMFSLITFLGAHYKNGLSDLKTLSSSMIKESFTNFNSKLIFFGFLIARQACFERPNTVFPSYLQWFSSSFSSESRRPIISKEICRFFFNFLTDIVPYESAYYLKVHINRSPWVPIDCQPLLSEYVTLVKTQLNDLNVSTELGICENITGKSAAVFDVENIIYHFERTNEILNTVFQAAMFCREYFEKKFLVELLSKFEGKKSPRHKVIIKLHSLGKIPNVMFKNYKSLEKKK